jgi:hypothetical protein
LFVWSTNKHLYWGDKLKKFKVAAIAAAFLFTTLTPVPATAAPLVVPIGNWPVCNQVRTDYCIESVSVRGIGSEPEKLTWSASGAATAATYPAGGLETGPGTQTVPGMWSSSSWSENGNADYGYDGVFIKMSTANQFTNHLSFEVVPVKVVAGATRQANQLEGISAPVDPTQPVPLPIANDAGVVPTIGAVATPVANTAYQASLNPNVTVIATVRIGDVIPGISIGMGRVVDVNATTAGKLVFTGTPVFTAEAGNTRDCQSGTGVAVANSFQIMAVTIVENDDQGFGVDGLSGKMSVTSNATCELSTPTWDEAAQSLTWTASAPHFAADGTSLNRGFYRAVIPAEDALLLWGLANPAQAKLALTVSVTNDGTNKQTAIRNIAFRKGAIRIEFSNFTFSKNTFVIKKNKNFSGFAAKRTLTCTKLASNKKPGKQVIVERGAYACPAGYKR